MKKRTIIALRNPKTLNSMISVKLTPRLIIHIIFKTRRMMIILRVMPEINLKNIESKQMKEKNKMKKIKRK